MKSKRLLSFVMALVLCCSLLPFGALAAEEETAEPEAEAIIPEEESTESSEFPAETEEITEEIAETEESAEEATEPKAIIIEDEAEESGEAATEEISEDGASSGTCGSNLTWTYENKTLTICGTGAMKDYGFTGSSSSRTREYAPWHSFTITKVVINSGVTSIGDSAFYCCEELVSVTVPNSVTVIGEEAFDGCSSLANVRLGSGLKEIGEEAFNDCSSLTGITIPDSVTVIGDNAFEFCSSLASLSLGSSLVEIGDYAFRYCSSLTGVTIPGNVASIGLSAFDHCTSLTNVTLSSGITGIGNYAFQFCSSLTGISIPGSVADIGDYAFYHCTGLTSATLGSGVEEIGRSAFNYCSKLTTVSIPASVGFIGQDAFGMCDALTCLYYAGSEEQWSNIRIGIYDSCMSELTIIYKSFSVTYNANGGSGAPAADIKKYGQSYTIPAAKPTRYGYEFQGWATSKTATTAKYLPGKSYTSLSGFNLYAVWKAKTYTVTYNANGGAGAPASGTKTYGKSFTVSGTKPTRSGYAFLGWATSKTATTAKYLPGKTYTSLSSFSLYAVWAKKNTVTYYANGGTGAPSSGVKVTGQSYTIPSTKPTRTGYQFLGWATSKTATTAKYLPGKTYSTLSSFSLYAVWAKKNTVTYNANGGTGAPSSGIKVTGQSYTIPTTKPTRTGYTFLGWATSKTAATAKYLPGKTYTTLSSFSLYAVWKKN